MPARLAAAHLVVARAGASTVAELACVGRPAILVPYPAAMDDHQTANAAALGAAGAALVLPEAGLTAEGLAAHIARLGEDPAALARMADAAGGQARPGAAEDLADLVETLSEGRTP
jgi:UDP-N-acetylglucosamine--N-acetylmuramyl-(pentapeptide) pyrophosphoryl-undecaprenol N-acetylglucosamine transferase